MECTTRDTWLGKEVVSLPPLAEELGVRLAPHPAQAARRKFQVSDCTPYINGVPELRLPIGVSNFSSG